LCCPVTLNDHQTDLSHTPAYVQVTLWYFTDKERIYKVNWISMDVNHQLTTWMIYSLAVTEAYAFVRTKPVQEVLLKRKEPNMICTP
jgi:hypothetical protein